MSKYLVTSSSYFEPFTYDELIKPVMLAQQAHNEAQNAYDQMAMDTAALENYISKDGAEDVLARKMYDNYKAKLDTLQNNLWNQGINSQTKRNLSAARAAYASDVLRLQKAVEARQQRSKEYWAARHNDPSLVASTDPGLAGLDNYLKNDFYGQDFYSYSGNQFMNEVAADAKARASEMIKDPEFSKRPELVGYLLMKSTEGWSSQEINNTVNALKNYYSGDTGALEKLTDGERILADVFNNHVKSTGAKEKLDSNEFDRLLNYGYQGLSHAVGKTSYSSISDKQWDYNKQVALAHLNASLNKTKDQVYNPYSIGSLKSERTSSGYDSMQEVIGKIHENYGDGKTVTVAAPDGTSKIFHDAWEATNNIYNDEARKRGRAELRGLDVGYDGNQTVSFTTSDNKTVTYHTGKMPRHMAKALGYDDGIIVYDSNNNIVGDWTKKFNDYRQSHIDHVNSYKKANPNVNFDSDNGIAVSPNKEHELRVKYNIPENIGTGDLGNVLSLINYHGEFPNGVLVGPDEQYDKARGNYTQRIIRSYQNAPRDKNGNLDKASRFGFYRVDGNGNASDTPITDINQVLGKGSRISSIEHSPIGSSVDGRSRVRITTSGPEGSGVFDIDASMLGPEEENIINTSNGIFDQFLMPVKDPIRVLSMNQKDAVNLTNIIRAYVHTFGLDNDPSSEFNYLMNASAKDIVRSRGLSQILYDAAAEMSTKMLSVPREVMYNEHMRDLFGKPSILNR